MLGLEDEFAFFGPGLPAGVMLVFGRKPKNIYIIARPMHFVTMMDHHWGGSWGGAYIYIYIYILETKIAPEMLGLEDEFAFLGPGLPAGVMLVFGSVYCSV